MNTDLQKKLLQYAPTPPDGAWDKIGKALDEGYNGVLANKFDGFEATPPQGSWNKIASKLETPVLMAPVARMSKFARIASAAAVLILAISAVIFLNRKETTPDITQTPPVALPPASASPSTNSDIAINKTSIIPVPGEDIRVNSQNTSSSTTTGHTNFSQPGENRKLSRFAGYALAGRVSEIEQPGINNLMVTHSFMPEEAERKETAASNIPVEKYMVYSDGEGQAMKVSKKLVDFFNCVREEWICQEQKKMLQEKMASQATNNDFTGIMTLLKNLTEPN